VQTALVCQDGPGDDLRLWVNFMRPTGLANMHITLGCEPGKTLEESFQESAANTQSCDLPSPAGHHGACHRGAMFKTGWRVLLRPPATTPACPGGAMFLRHSAGSGTRRADWQRRQCRLNTAPR